MTTVRQLYDLRPELTGVPPQRDWPTMYDLPSEDPQEPGLPDEFHALQPQLLSASLLLPNAAKDQVFTGMDLNLYYDRDHPQWHKRPDWFMVTDVPRLYAGQDLRLSYVVWDEQVVPKVIVELISPGTQRSDLGQIKRDPDGTPTKWQVYEQILKVPYYTVYDRYQEQWRVFEWVEGRYQAQSICDDRYWLTELNIGLGLWQGEYQGITRKWLRWYDAHQKWLPTEAEQHAQNAAAERHRADIEQRRADAEQQRADAEQQRADAEQQRADAEQKRAKAEQRRADAEQKRAKAEQRRADAEQQRAEKLADRLRALGIDPSAIE